MKLKVIVHIVGTPEPIIGKVFPMDGVAYASIAEIMEDAKKRGHLSITTGEGIVTVNTDHIIMIRDG